jgi:hypothetical protein
LNHFLGAWLFKFDLNFSWLIKLKFGILVVRWWLFVGLILGVFIEHTRYFIELRRVIFFVILKVQVLGLSKFVRMCHVFFFWPLVYWRMLVV